MAVDNFNGIKILNRTIRVDHVADYKVPKDGKKTDDETKQLYGEGCAPKNESIRPPKAKTPPFNDFRETIADQIVADIKLPARLPIYPIKQEIDDGADNRREKVKNEKKRKKDKKKRKKTRKRSSSQSDDSDNEKRKKKREKH